MLSRFVLVLVSAVLSALSVDARPQYDKFNTVSYISGADGQATIIEEENKQNDGSGNYAYRYSTSNGITQSEEGVFEPGQEPDTGDMEVTGSYSYVDPNGLTRTISYTAGVGGFQAQGDDIPTSVPTQYPLPVVPDRDERDGRGGGGGGGSPGTQSFVNFSR